MVGNQPYLKRTAAGLVDTRTGELLTDPGHFGALNRPERKKEKQVYTPSGEIEARPYGVKTLRSLLALPLITLILIVMTIAIVAGIFCNGSPLVKHHEPDPVNLPSQLWMWER